MKRNIMISTCVAALLTLQAQAQNFTTKKAVLGQLRVANDYFMKKWPDPIKPLLPIRKDPPNIWTRGVYYEGYWPL